MKRTAAFSGAATGLVFSFLILVTHSARGQNICNSSGNLVIFTNYDGGHLNIVINQNIPNLKIGICSYEACSINLSGTFVGNVTEVRYAGYNNPNNNSCTGGNIATTVINGAGSASTSIIFAPASPLPNSNGYGSIICGYSCDNNSNQGGCNTVDQVEAYFLGYFSGSTLYSHKVQYGCWTGTHSVSVGGNCCPVAPLLPGGISGTQTLCAGQTPTALLSATAASGGAGTISYTWQTSNVSQSSGFSNVFSSNSASFQPGSLSATTWFRRASGTPSNSAVYSNVIAVTVYPLPLLNISANAPLCEGETLIVNAQAGAQSYTWTGPSLFNSSAAGFSMVAQPSAGGIYSLVAQSAMGCQNSGTLAVVIHPEPVVSAAADKTLVCSGENIHLTGNGAATYIWEPGSVSGIQVTVTPAVTTEYTVTGIDQNNCDAAAMLLIVVKPKLSPNAQASDSVICAGDQVILSAAGSPSLVWMPGAVSGSVVAVTPSASVIYTVQGTDPDDCMHDGLVSLTVNPVPDVTVSAQPALICAGESATLSAAGNGTLQWLPPFTAPGFTVKVSPASTTAYSVKAVGANGCESASSVSLNVDPCLGMPQTAVLPGMVSIIPNPSTGAFLISAREPLKVSVYDVTGALLISTDLSSANHFSVSVGDLPPGIYLIRAGDGSLVGKATVVK